MANKKEIIFSKEEQKNSNRIYKSATPKQTTDWYIKWAASGVLLTAMVIRSAGVSNLADTILSFIGLLYNIPDGYVGNNIPLFNTTYLHLLRKSIICSLI